MKKNDIAAIVLIVAIAGVVSYFIANAVVGKPQNKPVQVEVVAPIAPNFKTPDQRIFNSSSVDPTVEITGSGPSADKLFQN